ncbi:MAG TPA: SMP-30/gluconolactonase/LRE family protein [Streptosporangiaceae bacterium]|jgi:sugar lactone lactonase YvrE
MPASQRPDIAFDGRAILGEGPVWDAERQRLVWLDILPGLVYRFDPRAARAEVRWLMPPMGQDGTPGEGPAV